VIAFCVLTTNITLFIGRVKELQKSHKKLKNAFLHRLNAVQFSVEENAKTSRSE